MTGEPFSPADKPSILHRVRQELQRLGLVANDPPAVAILLRSGNYVGYQFTFEQARAIWQAENDRVDVIRPEES